MVDRRIAQALAGSAAASAAVAESAADLLTPPGLAWRWIVRPRALELYAAAVPAEADRRLTLIGGGAALHRARVALAAEGLAVAVTLLPDADPDHLASLVPAGSIAVTDEARALYEATDRMGPRPGTARGRHEVPPGHAELAAALVRAGTAEGVGVSVRQESGELIAVLYGEDSPEAWLRAGAAVSAIRLEAARRGLTAVPTVAGRERPRRPGTRPSPVQGDDRRRDRISIAYAHLRID